MKKFEFSLRALLEVREAQREKLQAELAAAKAVLGRLRAEKAALECTWAEESVAFEARAKRGVTPAALEAWGMYLEELHRRLTAAEGQIVRAEETLSRRQAALVEVHQAIKTLEKLRRKQYLVYLAGERKAEADAREDILAFQTCCGKAAGAEGAETAS